MKFERTKTFNFDGALRGMRNPKNSWAKSDSAFGVDVDMNDGIMTGYSEICHIGENDMDLAQRLIAGGSPHRKFIRQIMVCVDITAPLFWWKEFDTYKVGTVADSTSTMHKLASTPITLDCFETDDYYPAAMETNDPYASAVGEFASDLIGYLESMRKRYNETGDKKIWKELIRWLPESWLQMRTVTLNYEVLRQICYWRKGHKLSEWQSFIDWAHTLPYAEEFIFYNGEKE